MSWPVALLASERVVRRVVRDCAVGGRGGIAWVWNVKGGLYALGMTECYGGRLIQAKLSIDGGSVLQE